MIADVRLIPVTGLPEIGPGDDLGRLIADAAAEQGTLIRSGDVVVVTQKIVSKAEGRLVRLSEVEPSPFAREITPPDRDPRQVEVVLRESRRIVKMDRGILITETRHGFICANSGVDASNAAPDTVVLLPEDPDASAYRLRAEFERRAGGGVAVIISDTFGRPWRSGLTDVAIGVSGLAPLVDYRGQTDPAGMELKVTIVNVADELAAAAELVGGKLDRVPVTIIRGYPYQPGEGSGRELVREPATDLFR
jgi:coenzyme F420-0:L-glutamate ligase/coenzyme F420-1:gamma-L-glutamate ligase